MGWGTDRSISVCNGKEQHEDAQDKCGRQVPKLSNCWPWHVAVTTCFFLVIWVGLVCKQGVGPTPCS